MGKIQESINKVIGASVVPATMVGAGKVAVENQAREQFAKEQSLPDIIAETEAYKEALNTAKKDVAIKEGEEREVAKGDVEKLEPLVKTGEELQEGIDLEWQMKKRALTASMAKQRNVSYFREGFKEFINKLTGGKD